MAKRKKKRLTLGSVTLRQRSDGTYTTTKREGRKKRGR